MLLLISFQPTLCWLMGEKAVDSSLKRNNFSSIALWLGCTYKSELIYGHVCMPMSVCACVVCVAGRVQLHVCACKCDHVACMSGCVCLSVWQSRGKCGCGLAASLLTWTRTRLLRSLGWGGHTSGQKGVARPCPMWYPRQKAVLLPVPTSPSCCPQRPSPAQNQTL